MTRPNTLCAILLAICATGLGGCLPAPGPSGPATADLSGEILRGKRPDGPEGSCWVSDETPAIIETITEQIAEPAVASQDAGYRTEIQQNIVEPREKIWFRTPCEVELTPDAITTLQRALAARGLYTAEVTGELDPPTRAAIRAYQAPRGLNSDRLSLAVAQELGVVVADLGQPKPDQPSP